MKIRFLEKLFLFVVGTCLALYACLWTFINVKGRDLLVSQLKEVTKEEVSIGMVDFRPFLGVRIDDLAIGAAKIEQIGVSMSLMHLMRGTIGFNAITIKDVEVKIVRDRKGVSVSSIPFGLPVSKDKPARRIKDKEASSDAKKMIPRFFVRRLTLDDIKIDYEDSAKGDTFEGTLYDLRVNIKDFRYPLAGKTHFDISSDLKLGQLLLEDNISFKGYIDFSHKSMDAALYVRTLPYRGFAAYYPPFWKPDSLKIDEAIFSLDSVFKAVNNDLTIGTNLHLTSYKFADTKEGQSRFSLMEGMLSLIDKDAQGNPTLYFEMQTELDKPRLDFSVVKAQMQAKAKKLPIVLGKEAIEGVTGVTQGSTEKAVDVTSDALDRILKSPENAKDIIKEAGKALKAIFVIEEEEDESPQNEAPVQE